MKSPVTRIINTILFFLILYFLLRFVQQNLESLKSYPIKVNVGFLLVACVVYVFFPFLISQVWLFLLKKLGSNAPFLKMFHMYIKSLMGKYVPGKASIMWLRINLASRYGIPAQHTFISTTYEILLQNVTGIWLFLLLLGNRAGIGNVAKLVVLTVFLVFFFHKGFRWGFNLLLRWMKKEEVAESRKITFINLVSTSCFFGAVWLVGGIAFFLYVSAFAHQTLEFGQLWSVGGIFIASYVSGFLAFFSPGGLGVREGVQIFFLKDLVGGELAIVVAVSFRLVTAMLELLILMAFELANIVKKTRGK